VILTIKKIARLLLPARIRLFIWSIFPRISIVNTLVYDKLDSNPSSLPIPAGYMLRELSWADKSDLEVFYNHLGPRAFDRNVPRRLNSKHCRCLAYFAESSGELVYVNWIHLKYDEYLREFEIYPTDPYVFWDSAYCLPDHRHRGLHERMEQELVDFSFNSGAKLFFMQIHQSNRKGNAYALKKGYKLLRADKVISWPAFNIYRNLNAFLKSPFKKKF
jgi:hypothetical protein